MMVDGLDAAGAGAGAEELVAALGAAAGAGAATFWMVTFWYWLLCRLPAAWA